MNWKPITINGIETSYIVSDKGNVVNKKTGHELTYTLDKRGYHRVFINKKGYRIHRLVAIAFIPNPENKPQVNHIDGNKDNNCVENLEWNTCSENMYHSYATGLHKPIGGEDHYNHKYSDEDIHKACKLLQEGYSCKEVCKLTGFSMALIRDINCHKTRKDITMLYNFDNTPKRRYRKYHKTIDNAIRSGFTTKDIVDVFMKFNVFKDRKTAERLVNYRRSAVKRDDERYLSVIYHRKFIGSTTIPWE